MPNLISLCNDFELSIRKVPCGNGWFVVVYLADELADLIVEAANADGYEAHVMNGRTPKGCLVVSINNL